MNLSYHVGTRSRRWWQSDSEEKTRKHCSKPLELFKETFSSHISGNKTAHFWLHIWTFYCCVDGKNKAGHFCKMLGHFSDCVCCNKYIFLTRRPYIYQLCHCQKKNGHFWWDDGKTPDFLRDKMSQFQTLDSPKALQLRVAPWRNVKFQYICWLLPLTFPSLGQQRICIADSLVNTVLGNELGFGFNSGIK